MGSGRTGGERVLEWGKRWEVKMRGGRDER